MSYRASILSGPPTFGTIVIAAGNTSNTATVAAGVGVVFLGASLDGAGGADSAFATLSLSGTTLTAARIGSSNNLTVSYMLLPFAAWVNRAAMQPISITIGTNVAQNNQTVTAVGANAILLWGGFSCDSSGLGSIDRCAAGITLTSPTNVRATRLGGGAGSGSTIVTGQLWDLR